MFAVAAGWLQAEPLWNAVGPAGGDARAFAPVPGQPSHLYLGTTNSWIYESLDEGVTWHRLAKLDPAEDLVVDNIVVDSAHAEVVFAGGWKADKKDGGLWVSKDAGRHWTEVDGMKGQSIFSLAQAPSDAKILFAGTLQGVYRSEDEGATWKQMSPEGNKEIHEVESLAVDPEHPDIVYAGTWHLPWKTEDGGAPSHNVPSAENATR